MCTGAAPPCPEIGRARPISPEPRTQNPEPVILSEAKDLSTKLHLHIIRGDENPCGETARLNNAFHPGTPPPPLSQSRTLPTTPVSFATTPPSDRPFPSALPVSFQNKAHISYQPHQTIASIPPNPYNPSHLQRLYVSVRCSGLCRTVANLFEISFFSLATQMLHTSAGLTFEGKARREGSDTQRG
jgi:hypothetical protein